jgi:hypothetical protein
MATNDGELERYRRAVEDLSQQLDWSIGYLHGIRKHQVASVLAQNRSFIKRELLKQDSEPLPTEKTAE